MDGGDRSRSELSLDHQNFVENAAFSTDGERVVTLSRGETASLRIWDAENGDELAHFEDLADNDLALATFTPDGEEMLTLSLSGVLMRWRVYPSTQALVDEAKRAIPRCLTARQLEEFGIGKESQSWCEADMIAAAE
jgi:WD40 repeat protein